MINFLNLNCAPNMVESSSTDSLNTGASLADAFKLKRKPLVSKKPKVTMQEILDQKKE